MKTLIVKLNATGDVVRTTCILRRLAGSVTWLTAPLNVPLLQGIAQNVRCLSWDQRDTVLEDHYDLLINLEDEIEVAAFAKRVSHHQAFGAYLGDHGQIRYTDDARRWFDMSLISTFGREKADELKLSNRRSYQDMIFEGLGWQFSGDRYLLPVSQATALAGDVAIASAAGPVWPMKTWAYYTDLQRALEAQGLSVNVLPRRPSLLEHVSDVKNHRCLVSGDSLPMHLALGVGIPCVTIFNCTSPWEIFDYGLQTKIVSPLLSQFFYKRGFDARATTAIELNTVLEAVMARLGKPPPH
jgi:ADP-heptose:LPS heptosyltransferase